MSLRGITPCNPEVVIQLFALAGRRWRFGLYGTSSAAQRDEALPAAPHKTHLCLPAEKGASKGAESVCRASRRMFRNPTVLTKCFHSAPHSTRRCTGTHRLLAVQQTLNAALNQA